MQQIPPRNDAAPLQNATIPMTATAQPCYRIQGGARLSGLVDVNGSKNASLPIMAACLLNTGENVLRNVPDLADVAIMAQVLETLGAKITREDHTMIIDTSGVNTFETPFELMTQMRASIYVMGPLLARYNRAKVAMPGGCAIGSRPVDYHIRGLQQMGVEMEMEQGYMDTRCDGLKGAHVYLDFPSVGATANLLMAATLAQGTTIIENAAEEPHIIDLAWFLRSIGARVRGAGTKTIHIEGVGKLHGAEHDMIPDQIEAGTLIVAAAITRGTVTVRRACIRDLKPILVKLQEAGVSIKESASELKISARKKLKPLTITTLPHPGFPTDMQPQMMALLTRADGVSIIRETVWENRYTHVAEFLRMGADIKVQGNTAIVVGGGKLVGCEVNSPDLRAGAGLVLAGLAAQDTTTVYNLEHVDRGYEAFDQKLRALGADITREPVSGK
jgi:UDP-N-acetylglucosamine 1-carboxyvinyltransferase